MGLDMWLYRKNVRHLADGEAKKWSAEGVPATVPSPLTPSAVTSVTVTEEVAYWRKEHNLLEMILNVSGFQGDANCADIHLTRDDLEVILRTIIEAEADPDDRETLTPYKDDVDHFVDYTVKALRDAIATYDDNDKVDQTGEYVYRSVYFHAWW